VVDWGSDMFASSCCESSCLLACAMDGRISAAAPLALANQLPLPMIVKRVWSYVSIELAAVTYVCDQALLTPWI